MKNQNQKKKTRQKTPNHAAFTEGPRAEPGFSPSS